MSDSVYIGQRASNIEVSPQFDTYSKVIIHVDEEHDIIVGDDTGRTLEIDNPFGTQTMATEILHKLSGYQYQPYKADNALLNPAAEIGDALDSASVYGGIFTRTRTFDRLMAANVSAPYDEEINHEYKYESPETRQFKRQTADIRASILLTSNMIKSEVKAREDADNELSSTITQTADGIRNEVVSKTGGVKSSFAWELTATSHKWYSNNREVMSITASGLSVEGKITAKEGTIGGFDIGQNELTYNGLEWGDDQKNKGAYIGTSGIQLGKNFSVDNSGKVRASSLTLKGNITFLNSDGTVAGTMSAANLQTGASQAYTNYGTWSSGAVGGIAFNNATLQYNAVGPAYFKAGQIRGTHLIGKSLTIEGGQDTSASINTNLSILSPFQFRLRNRYLYTDTLRYVSEVIGGIPEYKTINVVKWSDYPVY